MFNNNLRLKERRKDLRKNQTEAETVIWQRLRAKRFFGLKFYRQYSVGNFILDFYCPEYKLAVEIDGGQHQDNKEYDIARTGFLNQNGIHVLRFWNNDVLKNIDSVLEQLRLDLGIE